MCARRTRATTRPAVTARGRQELPASARAFATIWRRMPTAIGLGAWIGLAAITHVCWRARRSAPALLCGWSWFLITLLPVIGVVQIGGQARADRYTYLPSIGLGVALIWGVPAWLGR